MSVAGFPANVAIRPAAPWTRKAVLDEAMIDEPSASRDGFERCPGRGGGSSVEATYASAPCPADRRVVHERSTTRVPSSLQRQSRSWNCSRSQAEEGTALLSWPSAPCLTSLLTTSYHLSRFALGRSLPPISCATARRVGTPCNRPAVLELPSRFFIRQAFHESDSRACRLGYS
jgi:hypothetical protein